MSKKKKQPEKVTVSNGDATDPPAPQPPDFDAARLLAYRQFSTYIDRALPKTPPSKRSAIAFVGDVDRATRKLRAKLDAIDDIERPVKPTISNARTGTSCGPWKVYRITTELGKQ